MPVLAVAAVAILAVAAVPGRQPVAVDHLVARAAPDPLVVALAATGVVSSQQHHQAVEAAQAAVVRVLRSRVRT